MPSPAPAPLLHALASASPRSVKQLVTKAEEMKNSALGQVKAWSSSNSLASLASLRNAVQVSQGGMKRSASDDHLSAAPSRHSVARVLAPRDKDQALQPLEEEDPRGSGSPSSSNEGATVRLGADEDEPSMRLPDEVPSAAFKGEVSRTRCPAFEPLS